MLLKRPHLLCYRARLEKSNGRNASSGTLVYWKDVVTGHLTAVGPIARRMVASSACATT